MADVATATSPLPKGASLLDRKLKRGVPSWISAGIVLAALIGGVAYIGFHLSEDLGGVQLGSVWPYVLLGVALLIALGFEFVNGFHDTANAVATVIYTHSLEPARRGGVVGHVQPDRRATSSGTVAFAIVTLLPVELILQVSTGAGFAMVLCAADCGDRLEPGHLVVRPAGIELAHHGRLDHRRGHGQPADESCRDGTSRAWTGSRRRRSSASLLISPVLGFVLGGAAAA